MKLIIGPGLTENNNIREAIFDVYCKNKQLFNSAKRKDFDEDSNYISVYRKTILSGNDYEDKEIDELQKIIVSRYTNFKQIDLPKIINHFKQHDNLINNA